MRSKSEASRKGHTGQGSTERPKREQRMRSEGRQARRGRENSDVLERGDIFFFYRPDAAGSPPGGLLDVNCFHLVPRPECGGVLRYITVGKKKLPEAGGDGRHWGFVDGVFREPEGLRQALDGTVAGAEGGPGRAAAVPAGEGVYALARHGRNTVLAYALELPEEPGEVQRAFHIARRGRLTLAIKNPEAGSPAGVGLDEDRRAEFPDGLRERFGDRKWIGADPPAFLDHEGAELILIAGDDAGPDLGLEPQPEDERSAEVFKDLQLERSERAIKPLFEGTWA
jgi:hypothetical protein